MKRRLILLAVGVSVACAVAFGVSTQARAGGNGAAVIRDGGRCPTTDNNGNAWLFSCNFQIVFTPTAWSHSTSRLGDPWGGQQPASLKGRHGRHGRALPRVRWSGDNHRRRRSRHPEREGATDLQKLRTEAGPS